MEIRHDSFRDPAFIELLRRHGIALVCADTVEWPQLMDLTADFVYMRLHGRALSQRLQPAGDPPLAARVRAWRDGKPMTDGHFIPPRQPRARPRDVFLHFDNTDKLQAPRDALALIKQVGQV